MTEATDQGTQAVCRSCGSGELRELFVAQMSWVGNVWIEDGEREFQSETRATTEDISHTEGYVCDSCGDWHDSIDDLATPEPPAPEVER